MASGAPRLACGLKIADSDSGSDADVPPDGTVCIFDPVAGGKALLVLGMGDEVKSLAVFKDPATGAPRLACGSEDKKVRVFDPVAGGEALVVIDAGDSVRALAFFTDPATGAPRLACGTSIDYGESGDVRVFNPVTGGEALVVIDVGSGVWALAVFADPATGELRLACGSGDFRIGGVHIFNPVAGGDALVVLEGHTRDVLALTVFTDPATGGLRLASGSRDNSVRIWDLVAGGAALLVLETRDINALTAFADPATGEMRLASGLADKTLRVWDASTGGAVLRVVPFEDEVKALTVGCDMSGLFVAFGKRWGELRI